MKGNVQKWKQPVEHHDDEQDVNVSCGQTLCVMKIVFG